MTLPDAKSLVDYAKSLDCIHCGLCLQSCPTFRLTGAESSSPRGRIHLMRAIGEERVEPNAAYGEELEFCLLCRHCESVCPAGVRFGPMMESARASYESVRPSGFLRRQLRSFGFRRLLPGRIALRLFGSFLRAVQVLGLDRIAFLVLGERGRDLVHLPRIAPLSARRLLPETIEAKVENGQEAAVGFLEGCVMPELFPHVNRAAANSLAALGARVHTPRGIVCCGSLHAHNGDLEGARMLARKLIEGFEPIKGGDGEAAPIVIHSAGCGAHMRELFELFEADDPWHARATAFAARVTDFTQYVAPLLAARTDVELDEGALEGPVTWDDPCHLCHAQGVREEPRDILARLVPNRRVELEGSENCCGSAGIYSLLRPADSRAVFDPKRAALERSGARTLVTANPGCQLQWQTGLRRAGSSVRVLHLAELVERALSRARSGRAGQQGHSAQQDA